MKILKLLFVVAMIQMITASCNSCQNSSKEEAQEESAVEMTDEGSESMEATGGEGEEASGAAASQAPVQAIDPTTSGVEEVPVDTSILAEELASTPVIYPGCEGGTADEIRACSIEKFRTYLAENFNSEIAEQLNMAPGDYQIRSILKVDEQGNLSVIRTTADNDELKLEMKRLIHNAPKVTPATHDGKPVSVHFMIPLDFKVE